MKTSFTIISCILVLCAITLHATTIYVPADQMSIQAGIDAAVNGDTVLVDCGIYNEYDILMKSGITLMSINSDPKCVIIYEQSQGDGIICENLAEIDEIKGLKIRNLTMSLQSMIN